MCSAATELWRGNSAAALALYRELLARNPDDDRILNRIGDVLAAAERLSEAVVHYFVVAELLEHHHSPRRALAIYHKILRLRPGETDARRAAARLRNVLGLPAAGRGDGRTAVGRGTQVEDRSLR